MEAFAPIFLFWIIIIFVSVVTKNSKQNAGKKGSAGNAGGQKAPNRAASASPRPAQAKPASAPQPRKAAAAAERKTAPIIHDEHAATPLEAHMHTMDMDREGEGAEGIDCCHDYMLAPSEPAPVQDFSSLSANDESQRAHALLQGVVFSEILGRRPVRRYGGKRA